MSPRKSLGQWWSQSHLSDVMHRVQDVIDTKFATTLPLANLARQAGVSERTVGFEDARMLRRLPAR